MMIYMLAAAMTIAMLIATVFGLHQETERMRLKEKRSTSQGFGQGFGHSFGSRLR